MLKRVVRPGLTGRRVMLLLALVLVAAALAVMDWNEWLGREARLEAEANEEKMADAGAGAQFDGIDEVPCDDDDGVLDLDAKEGKSH